ncbi:MAG: carbohydrate ABC transporter permease, partial [Thermomicrobiales bacterium]
MTAQSSSMRSAAITAGRRQPMTPGRLVSRVAIYLVLSVGALLAAFPFIWMVLTSLKTQQEALRFTILPKVLQWHNYPDAWHAAPFGRYFFNTIVIAVLVVVGMLFTSTLAAYAFARLNFWGKNIIFALFLATMMIPFE